MNITRKAWNFLISQHQQHSQDNIQEWENFDSKLEPFSHGVTRAFLAFEEKIKQRLGVIPTTKDGNLKGDVLQALEQPMEEEKLLL